MSDDETTLDHHVWCLTHDKTTFWWLNLVKPFLDAWIMLNMLTIVKPSCLIVVCIYIIYIYIIYIYIYNIIIYIYTSNHYCCYISVPHPSPKRAGLVPKVSATCSSWSSPSHYLSSGRDLWICGGTTSSDGRKRPWLVGFKPGKAGFHAMKSWEFGGIWWDFNVSDFSGISWFLVGFTWILMILVGFDGDLEVCWWDLSMNQREFCRFYGIWVCLKRGYKHRWTSEIGGYPIWDTPVYPWESGSRSMIGEVYKWLVCTYCG